MTEDERAQMFYEECMEQAGVENPPPLIDNPPEACGPGAPLSDQSAKG